MCARTLKPRGRATPATARRPELVPAGQAGWSWPRALFWKLSISLPEVPLPSRPPLLFSFLTSARGEIPAAGMGDTSSSLAGGSQATPAESPAEPHSHGATHRAMGPTPSHQHNPETADGAENMASGTAANIFRKKRIRPFWPTKQPGKANQRYKEVSRPIGQKGHAE